MSFASKASVVARYDAAVGLGVVKLALPVIDEICARAKPSNSSSVRSCKDSLTLAIFFFFPEDGAGGKSPFHFNPAPFHVSPAWFHFNMSAVCERKQDCRQLFFERQRKKCVKTGTKLK